MTGVPWNTLNANIQNAWLTEGLQADFEDFLPIASKEAKASKSSDVQAIFKTYSLGVSTNRDSIVYDHQQAELEQRVAAFIGSYNNELARWISAKRPKAVDEFLSYKQVKWSEHLKNELRRGRQGELDNKSLRIATYRPFSKQYLYYNELLVDRPGAFEKIFPTNASEKENIAIGLSGIASSKPFQCFATDRICSLDLLEKTQCFPLYTYALDGKIQRDNITDWALAQFRAKYGPDVTKPDIFHYVYALLHHPEYRARYKENLKRELPRVPLVEPTPPQHWLPGGQAATLPQREGEELEPLSPPASGGPLRSNLLRSKEVGSFRAIVSAGEKLAALHVGYEQADEYPLTWEETDGAAFSWRVTKMRLSSDKTQLKVNAGLTLTGIPPEAFEYRLGNRSALEWVLDQYQVSTDKRSGIGSDPNRDDDPEYIVKLVGRVVTVSVETVRIIAALPALGFGGEENAAP